MAAAQSQLTMLPKMIKPMLAQTAKAPFDSEEHLFEIKWDGIRCLAFVEAGCVRLQSRQLFEITRQFPELSSLGRLPCGTLLDVELVVLKGGKPCFKQMQTRAQLQSPHRILFLSQSAPVTYVVFDILYIRGSSMIAAPLIARRAALNKLLCTRSLPGILVSEGITGNGRDFFRQVVELSLEGVMAKHLDSPYLGGRRSRAWQKLKVSACPPTPPSTSSNGHIGI